MTVLLAESFELCVHNLGMTDILQFLEIFRSIFNHELKAFRVILAILSVNKVVDSTCDAAPLVWR